MDRNVKFLLGFKNINYNIIFNIIAFDIYYVN